MNNSELIEKNYLEAVNGIKEVWFLNVNTNWYNYIVNLPNNIMNTYLINILNNQVINGGFHQYFVNGYGQFAFETVEALFNIGSYKRSSLLKSAYENVNKNNLPNEVFRNQLLAKKIEPLFKTDELFESLDDLDSDYYNITDEDIQELLGFYLQNPS